MDITKKNHCCVCLSQDVSPRYSDVPDYEYGIYHPVNYMQCNRCKILSQNPLPPKNVISKFYPVNYRNHLSFGLNSSYTKLKYFKIWSLARDIGNFLRNDMSAKILEIGCGGGMLLFMLRRRGFRNLSGTDISDSAEKDLLRKEIKFEKENIELKFPYKSKFDLIVLNHVFEHLLNPMHVLNLCRIHLKSGGKLVIITPNADSYSANIFKKYWDGVNAPRHFFIFNYKSMLIVKRKFNFKSVKYYATPDPMNWAISLQNFFQSKSVLRVTLKNGLAWYTVILGIIFIPLSVFTILGKKSASMMCVFEN